MILTASSNGVETGLQIAYFEVHTDWVRSLMLVLMEFSFSKTDFKSGLRATGSMMAGNACVAFLILGNRNWVSFVVLMVIGLSLILFTSMSIDFAKEARND